ncbi:hypothetical protein KEJ47_05855 [Candidatus Bathyarchaeota archaeon]|nr:hypothetical protein [Candidatus Bathyarchaeota archaeon]
MKKILVVFMCIMFLQASLNVSAQTVDEPVVSAMREVSIMRGGIVIVNDTLVFEAPANTAVTVSSIRVGYPTYLSVEKCSFYLFTEDERWELLPSEKIEGMDSMFIFYRIDLPTTVQLSQNKKLYVKASYLSVKQVEWNVNVYSAVIPIYPALNFNISSFKFNMSLPVNAELVKLDSILSFTNITINGVTRVNHVASDLSSLRNENVTLKYKPSVDDSYLFEFESLTRHLTILQGKVLFEDVYSLKNRGSSLSKLVLKLPESASDMKGFDSVGALEASSKVIDGNETYTELTVRLRSSLRQNDRLNLRVEYYIPDGEFLTTVNEKYLFNYSFKEYPFYLYNLSLAITLPEGASFSSSTPSPTKIQQESSFTQKIQFNIGSFAPSDRLELLLNYNRSVIWIIFRPLQWILVGVVVAGSFYIVYRRKPKRAEKLEAPTASSDLNNLLEYYKERLALLLEFEQMDEKLEKREVSREHFERRAAEITKRLNELRTLIRKVEDKLKAEQPNLVEKLKIIKNADMDLENAVTDLRNLQTRFRIRRIPRVEYISKRKEAMRKLSQTRRRLEEIIHGFTNVK